MIKAFLEGLEDSNRPLMARNYWTLKKMGLLLPKNAYGVFLYLSIHASITFFVVSQFMEIYVIRSDLDLVLTNLKISMQSMVCIVKVLSFVFWQESWKDLLRYVTEADADERSSRDESKKRIVDTYTRYCRRLTYFYWVLMFTTSLMIVCQPLVLYLTSANMRDSFRNGTIGFPHIFISWMPFDKEHAPGCWVTVVWHTYVCACGASMVAAFDASMIVIMVFFGGKLDLLRVRCRQMLGRAGAGVSDTEFDAVVKQLHQIHVQLIKYSRLFNSLLSPVLFIYIVICSLMLCASAYQLISATNTGQKLIMAEYLIFGIAQLFVFCWHSNDVLVKSEGVSMGVYESAWWQASLRQRRAVLLLAGQLRIRSLFSAGPFVHLTLPTFVTILKGAYSFFTLLRK